MAEHTSHPMAMESSSGAEFASEQYWAKFRQLKAQQPAATETLDAPSGSRFILPLRESRNADVEVLKPSSKRDKGRFSSIRHKLPLLHSKSSHGEASADVSLSDPYFQSRASVEGARRRYGSTQNIPIALWNLTVYRSVPFDQLFFILPNELQIQIISSLPLNDILNLRLISKSWHALISLNEGPIVRYCLEHHIPAYARRLYPISEPAEYTFHYLCGIWHRLHVAAKLSFLMCEWITKDIFLRQTEAQRLAFAPQNERMRRRLIPLLFTIFHFFETYRKLHLQHLAEKGTGLRREPYTVNPIEAEIMGMYDDKTLLRVHEVFPLVISSFCRRLRPPTYVGRVERSLRGYLREKPADEVHVAILCIGGLREVEKLWEIKGYNSRRTAVDTWFQGLTKDRPVPEAPSTSSKPRRGLFGRKKSEKSAADPLTRRRSSAASVNSMEMGFDSNFVFNTSLSAGVPMAPLNRQQAQAVLDDLPVLQQIWLQTAEALVLKRKVVDRPQDIKRNQQVMLDLICEDGLDEEDEWWYGRGIPDSVRPPTDVNDDDAD